MIGIAGSVAVGKSTTARILQALLSRWPDHPRVDLITTDGFLFPNRVLEERGLMLRKGFPESYDVRHLIRFVSEVKSGRSPLFAPLYSHLRYDILPDRYQTVDRPDVVIIEGLNVLQTGAGSPVFVSDFFDFSIYVDAPLENLRQWYVGALHAAARDGLPGPGLVLPPLHRAFRTRRRGSWRCRSGWRSTRLNLRENIEPTRERASLVLEKGERHSVRRVRMRKL